VQNRPVIGNEDVFIKKMQKVINKIMPGLMMFVRDVNLPYYIVKKYFPDWA
jgi:hypothetical protein